MEKSNETKIKAKKNKDGVKAKDKSMSKANKKGDQDARFDTSNDPRFKQLPKEMKKVKVDERFKGMFSEKFAEPAKVDRHGRGRAGTKSTTDMRKFYDIEGDSGKESDDGTFHWDENIESSDEEELDDLEEEAPAWEDEEDAPMAEDISRRLAIMGCDWDNVAADDLFVLLYTYVDSNKSKRKLEHVAVYPSDYGLEKMEREKTHGPEIDGIKLNSLEEGEEESKENIAAIRQYQKQRTKYYFAVATFDCAETAAWAYDQLDGLTVENMFMGMADFRFIPDEVEMPHAPASEATQVPANYEPPEINQALKHSKVTCSWDEEPASRRKAFKKNMSQKELMDLDMKAYLASSSDEDLDEDKVEGYRNALLGNDESASEDEKPMGDISVTFDKNLENLANDIKSRAIKAAKAGTLEGGLKSEKKSSWALYLEKKAAKKKERKELLKAKLKEVKGNRFGATQPQSDGEDAGEEMMIPQKKSKKPLRAAVAEAEEEDPVDTADLELLVGEENDRHFDIKTRKGKKHKKRLDAQTEAFDVDLEDSRLGAMFRNPEFAIDPTHPEYKKTKAMTTLQRETTAQRKKAKASSKRVHVEVQEEQDMDIFKTKKKKKAH